MTTIADYCVIKDNTILPVTPALVAEMFCHMYADEQAQFYNHVAAIASIWSHPFCFQLQAITDDKGLTLAGRRVMQEIGEYSHWGLAPK